MRINAGINAVSQNDAISSYMTKVNSTPAKASAVGEISDSVQLSDGAQKYASLLKTAKDSMDNSSAAEDAKVADIMARMNNNTYNVPTGDVVSGIMGSFSAQA